MTRNNRSSRTAGDRRQRMVTAGSRVFIRAAYVAQYPDPVAFAPVRP